MQREFENIFIRLLKDERDACSDALLSGKYESFESYKFDAGRLSGLDTAIESFKLAKDKFNNEE